MIKKWKSRLERSWWWVMWLVYFVRLGPASRRKVLDRQPSHRKPIAT